jgi:hypothetical protein
MKMRASSAKVALFGALTVVTAFSLFSLSSLNAHNTIKTPAKSQAANETSPLRARIAAEAFGKLPLAFEKNLGQTDSQVRYLAHANGYELFLTPTEAVLALQQTQSRPEAASQRRDIGSIKAAVPPRVMPASSVLRLKLSGASQSAEMEGSGQLERKTNYFIGNDRKNWVTNVPSYTSVEYKDVYPGIDLIFYGNQRRLEYDFVVSAGADPEKLALKVESAGKLRTDAQGNLVLKAAGGYVNFEKPVIYQEVAGTRQTIGGGYVLGKQQEIKFAVGAYDHSLPLIVDPVLNYSTYVGGGVSGGGTAGDASYSIAVDALGDAFITGTTYNSTFPLSTSPATKAYTTTAPADITSGAVFVAELDPTGANELYFTYLGGDGGETGNAIAVDPIANTTCMNGAAPGYCVYVTGQTLSTTFPVSSLVTPYNAMTPTGPAPTGGNAFITKLNPYTSGSNSLVYSSFLSSSNAGDNGRGVAVDSSQDAYITGIALAGPGAPPNFPILNGAQTTLQASSPADGNAFLAVLNTTASSSALVYSTYLGGDDANGASAGSGDSGFGVVVDSSKVAYLVGFTPSSNFPNLNSTGTFPSIKGFAAQPASNTGAAFVAAVNTTLTGVNSLLYSTYLGGSNFDLGNAIALVGNGVVAVTGQTSSLNFPVFPVGTQTGTTPGKFPSPPATSGVVYITELNTKATGNPPYSTLLGGTGGDTGNGIQVDSLGNIIVAGTSSSTNFPVTLGAFKTALSGSPLRGDAFISKLNPGGNSSADLLYSSYFGGSGNTVASTNYTDQGFGVAVDTTGNAYLTGQTFSASDFPLTTGAFETSFPGGALSAGFVSKLTLIPTVGFAVGSTACSSTAAATACPIGFNTQLINTASASQNVILTNNTSVAVPITLPVTVSGANASDFAAAPAVAGSTAACTASLAAGASCAIGVVFTPTTSAAETASLSVSYTAGASTNPAATELFAMTGTGISPTVVLNPTTTLNFATPQPVGTTSSAQGVTVSNTGTGNLNFTAAPALSGANAGDFAISSGTTCTNGGTVTPSSTCTVNITFTPTATGARTATLTLTDNASNSPQTITITGTGAAAAPVATITPLAGLAFGNQLVTTTSAAQTVTVKNTGNVNLNITAAPAFSGTNASDFAIASGTTCTNGVSVTPNSTCLINVTFTPPANGTGSRTAALNISDNAAGSPQAVALTGTGTVAAPGTSVLPTTLTFAGQLVTTTSAAQTVTVKNTGGSNLTISSAPSISGTNASDFAIATGTTCTSGSSIAANATCIINVTFTPPAGAAGSRTATLSIADNAAGSPQSVTLSGTAGDFTVSAQGATINAGSTATIAVTVGSVGGFTGAVTLTCTATIPDGSCNAPATAVTAPGTANVTVSTQGSLVPPASDRKPPISMQQAALVALALMLLLTLPVARRFRTRLGLAGAAAVLVLVAGCSHTLRTPSGSYPVTITGTSGSVTHAVTVTVTVN